MININELQDELYAIKVLVELANKYMDSDSEKLNAILIFCSRGGSLPGRYVAQAFSQKKLNHRDTEIVQEIVNIYG